MTDPAYFQQLFAYDDWANAGHLDGLAKAASPAALKAMAHLLAAREIWLLRVTGQPVGELKFFRHIDADQCRTLHEKVHREWQTWLGTLTPEQLTEQVTFKDSLGTPYTLERRTMLMHVLLHSAHHRGQVAMAQRQAGFTPTDFDLYLSPLAQH